MKYYLVALFDDESYSHIEKIQKSICKKYKLYRNMPVLHLTLEVIDESKNLEEACRIIRDILRPYKKFKISINGAICFDAPYKSVNLNIENKGYIMRLTRQINDRLKLCGFKVREDVESWDLHISLANTNYATRQWSNKEYANTCEVVKEMDIQKNITVKEIQLWKPINNKKEMVVESFPLKDY
ncbi:2'-5' RNA ligase family protein [Clostridium tetani]|uniref:2'-5' RNA ligase family protein n=1 Tax=Clostridium tetani TaxID=1513 RepID=A0ABY0ES32_CLOTA|nr:2'-5' RNA ligase family protein [Clostridium tetani]CDI48213.1 2'-5' RNA ligase [Clostridium tetani 12124569]KHO40399.1 hypothetical protein OR62_00685 [Clostridium tetani]RXI40564.1 2'-5' RNA ligase family protein [Clostridium tetani]RXI58260.1 2'-5' RNA ligase family protein [Clostridium tetani]RXI70572.1 2'-5' RNA ligase family protein [Clostridium tetani]